MSKQINGIVVTTGITAGHRGYSPPCGSCPLNHAEGIVVTGEN